MRACLDLGQVSQKRPDDVKEPFAPGRLRGGQRRGESNSPLNRGDRRNPILEAPPGPAGAAVNSGCWRAVGTCLPPHDAPAQRPCHGRKVHRVTRADAAIAGEAPPGTDAPRLRSRRTARLELRRGGIDGQLAVFSENPDVLRDALPFRGKKKGADGGTRPTYLLQADGKRTRRLWSR